MHTIKAIISNFTPEQQREFIRFLNERNTRTDTKNIALFKLLSKGASSKDIQNKLYDTPEPGAYHALSKRLHDTLIDFIASKNLQKESSKEMSAMKLVLASGNFFQNKQVELAFKTLAKAEIIANKYGLYSILNEIYCEQISNAHLHSNSDLNLIISNYTINKQRLIEDEKLNIFYASIQAQLNSSTVNVSDIIHRNLKLFDISISKHLSYNALLKILHISNEVAHISRDYHAVLEFIESSCKIIEVSQRIEGKHLHAHLQILYYLANTYFRIKNFEVAKSYLNEMFYYMQLKKGTYYQSFLPQYELLNNLLLIYTGQNALAISNLEAFNYSKFKNKPTYPLFLKLSQIVALFLDQQFKTAFQCYSNFKHSDNWYAKKTDNIWVAQKSLIEILLLVELEYTDLLDSRILSFKRRHKANIIAKKEEKVLSFLKLIELYSRDKSIVHSTSFQLETRQLLKTKTAQEDVFSISFYAWLLSKIEDRNPYKICLKLVKPSY